MVLRAGLTDRLAAAGGPAVVSIVAPAGYGKTTLLRLWADRQPSVAYVALEASDSDPVQLLSCLATSLDRVESLDPGILRLIRSPGRSLESTVLPALVEAIWARRTPTVLMLDDVHRLDGVVPLDVIAFLMLRLPTNLRLALTARRVLPLPFARLRVAGQLMELDARDLALDAVAARTMATAMGVAITDEDIAEALTRTEGWPAATYLGLRSLGAVGTRYQPVDELRGTERTIADYMRSELLEPLDAESQRWLLRSSALDVMTGPLCDAALDTSGSLALLRVLEDNNLLVVALDAHRDAYRYHRLFRDLLRDELDIREPGAAAQASARAAAWCAEHDQPEDAVDYARASGDMDLLARLVLSYTFAMHYSGRGATLSRWFDWFDHDGQREWRAAIAVLAGWVNAMDGRTMKATDWLASAERSRDASPMPDGASKEAWLAVLRGYMAPAGMPTLMSDARTALAGIAETSPFRQGALVLAGLADVAAGSPDTADELLAEAADMAEARGAMPGLALALDRNEGVMSQRPRPPGGGLLDPGSTRFIVATGVFKGALGIAALLILPLVGFTLIAIQTAIFQTEAIGKLLSTYGARSLTGRAGRNLALHGAVLAGLALQVVTMTVLAVRDLLGLSPPAPYIVLAVALVVVVGESGQHALAWWFGRTAVARPLQHA